jgi:hypothetical protein
MAMGRNTSLRQAGRTAMIAAAAASAQLLGGCATKPPPPPPGPQPVVEVLEQLAWQGIASGEDSQRIERIKDAWQQALDEAREKGFRRAIEAEGELLKPDAALPRPAPTPGSYRCRVIKLGTQGGKGAAFNAYKPFFCYVEVEADLLTIVKQTGSQRPAGRLYPDANENQLIFLGTLALGTEEAPLAYGENEQRNMAGVFERVAPFRFRLVIPWPRYESKLDVIELVPVPPQP